MKHKFKNKTVFRIKALNQEKFLNALSKEVSLEEIERHSKNETTFSCSFFEHKKVDSLLKGKDIEILSKSHYGVAQKIKQIFTSYGILTAFFLFIVLYFVQSPFIWQYEIRGDVRLDKNEVVEFVKENFPQSKNRIDTEEVEVCLVDSFEEISFASCIIKGQTLVINLKEKLLPDEIYGQFQPIISQKYGKISEIELISGTLNVKVGDIVKSGDVLVEPYTIDTSGNIKQVEAKARIVAEVYNEGQSQHAEKSIEIVRTGRIAEKNKITLFGMDIYSYEDSQDFELYETEQAEIDLIDNLPLPFKMQKTTYYELQEVVTESVFEEVKDQYIEKAREKALANCKNCDTIIEEFYTIRHLSGITIVNFCIITQEEIGVAT